MPRRRSTNDAAPRSASPLSASTRAQRARASSVAGSPARGALLELLSVLERDFGALPEQTVIGGFSQGAMLATDTVLRSTRPFGALAILSGSLISHDEWLPLMGARRGLPVLQSHGRTDPVLPFELAERLCSELVAAGLPVEFVAFNGGHGIPGGVLEGLTRLVRRLTPEPA